MLLLSARAPLQMHKAQQELLSTRDWVVPAKGLARVCRGDVLTAASSGHFCRCIDVSVGELLKDGHWAGFM